MTGVTFFGEVNELNSRAIWWSDDEEVDEEDGERHCNDFNVIINVKSQVKCETIYVSLSKGGKRGVNSLSELGVISMSGIAGIVGRVFAVNDTSVWLQLNANYETLKNYLVSKTIRALMKKVLSEWKAIADNIIDNPLVIIVSKDFVSESTPKERIYYLTNNSEAALRLPYICKCTPLIAPQMMTNSVEASIFEFCYIFNHNCVALKLPDIQQTCLDSLLIPKQILASIQAYNSVPDSNIFV